MNKSIQHLRASESVWAANDIVIPDGEIAILRTAAGTQKIKIGNGSDKFSLLPTIGGDAVESADDVTVVVPSRVYRLYERAAVNIFLPNHPDFDFYTEISFSTADDAAEFSTNISIRFTGDDVAGEEFIPNTNMHYTVFIWFDGEYQGVVRGLPNA